jgi:hypothetical protein
MIWKKNLQYSVNHRGFSSPRSGVGSSVAKVPIRGNFKEFHDEVIAQLDALVEGGKGDDHYRHTFKEIVGELCSKNRDLCKMVRNSQLSFP